MKRFSDVSELVLMAWLGHLIIVRILLLLMLLGPACVTLPNGADDAAGLWEVTSASSTVGSPGERLAVRFEPHARGEVFTLDRIDRNGRSTTTSTILYFDSKPREFQDFECSGTQSSRRLDTQTVEILRTCSRGEWTRFVRRLSIPPNELVLEITEQRPDGRRFERNLPLKKQFGGGSKQPKSSENERRER